MVLFMTQTLLIYTTNKLKKLQLNAGGTTTPFIGKTKSIQHWDYLTDEEMESLTGYQSYAQMTSQFNFNTL